MIEWMLFPFNIRHFDCVPMHQTTSTTINRSKNSGQWREDSYARHAYNNNYATQWKDVGSHSCNRQMMHYILPFVLFCHRRSRWCKTFLYFVRLAVFFLMMCDRRQCGLVVGTWLYVEPRWDMAELRKVSTYVESVRSYELLVESRVHT